MVVVAVCAVTDAGKSAGGLGIVFVFVVFVAMSPSSLTLVVSIV
jgi:hypothetical protein